MTWIDWTTFGCQILATVALYRWSSSLTRRERRLNTRIMRLYDYEAILWKFETLVYQRQPRTVEPKPKPLRELN